MTSRLGPKGQVVIPKPMRDALGLGPGDEVTFALEGRSVRVSPSRPAGSSAGSLAGRGLVTMLERDHRAELTRPPAALSTASMPGRSSPGSREPSGRAAGSRRGSPAAMR